MAAAAPSPTTLRLRAALLSLVIGALLLAIKLGAWALTGSTAVLSDALESIVNVIAAGFAVYSVHLSRKPPDLDHPYGHGKIEFLSAGFEGGLIFVAGGLIIFEATRRLVVGVALARLSEGIGLVAFAAVVNLILGLYLIRTGKKTHSLTLVADGKHLLTDVYTSAATAAALAVVLLTGWRWIDPAFAIVAALNILRIGLGLMREAVGGIMDEADPEDLKIVAEALAQPRRPPLRRVVAAPLPAPGGAPPRGSHRLRPRRDRRRRRPRPGRPGGADHRQRPRGGRGHLPRGARVVAPAPRRGPGGAASGRGPPLTARARTPGQAHRPLALPGRVD